MSDQQPIAPIERTPSPIAAPVAPATASDTAPEAHTAAPEPSVPAETKLETPLEQMAQAVDAPASWLWMTKYDQLFVGVFAAVFLALSGYHWATLGGWGMRPIELDRLPARQYDFRIDINSASWVEWTQIESIGETTAQKIIADRDAHGAFKSIDDLLRVKGIGPKTLEKMRPYLREPASEAIAPKLAP